MVRRFSPLSRCLPGLLYRSACVQRESRQALSASDIAIQSLSFSLSLSLSARARREEEKREREGHRRKSMGAMLEFSSLSSFPFLALPLIPTPISSHYPSPFLRLQPLRLDIKVRMDLKKERRGVGLCFLFSLLFSFFNASLFFSRSPIKLLPIFLFLPLPTHQQKRFSQRTDRVKGVDLHPTEPW